MHVIIHLKITLVARRVITNLQFSKKGFEVSQFLSSEFLWFCFSKVPVYLLFIILILILLQETSFINCSSLLLNIICTVDIITYSFSIVGFQFFVQKKKQWKTSFKYFLLVPEQKATRNKNCVIMYVWLLRVMCKLLVIIVYCQKSF